MVSTNDKIQQNVDGRTFCMLEMLMTNKNYPSKKKNRINKHKEMREKTIRKIERKGEICYAVYKYRKK